jgi:hypothetical protein
VFGALAVLDGPDVHRGRVEFDVVALREVDDERYDRLVAVVDEVPDDDPERPAGSFDELLKEAQDLVVSRVVARDGVAA